MNHCFVKEKNGGEISLQVLPPPAARDKLRAAE
jgi:hypothetical protein